MGRKRRLLFVLNDKLGWRTYSAQVRAVLSGRSDFEWEVVTPPSARWLRFALKNHNLGPRSRFLRRVDPIQAWRGYLGRPLRAAVDRFKPDLVHFGGHLPAASMLELRGAPPYSVTLDATRPNMNSLRGTPIWTPAECANEAALLQRALQLFPWSSWAAEALTGACGVSADRVCVIPPSINPTIIGAPRPKSGGGLPLVLFIGNDFLRKGGDKLHRWVTGPLAGRCELHIVSGDPRVQGLAGPRVVVHGGVPHNQLMGELLPSMDLLCHPTQSDMSAYVIVEASFAGVPAVASRVGGIPELILAGQSGWTLERSDEAGFIQTLETLLDNPERLADAGRAAHRHAAATFDARPNYTRMLNLLEAAAR